MGKRNLFENAIESDRLSDDFSEKSDPFLTAEEVAFYLRLKPETVRSMVRHGKIPGLK